MAVALAAGGWHLDGATAVEVLRGEGLRLEHLGGCALEHYFSAQSAGARPDVDHIVGGEHHVLVVLNDHHGVAKVAQLLERVDKAHVVALVEADAGLVEYVKHVDELRTYLCG